VSETGVIYLDDSDDMERLRTGASHAVSCVLTSGSIEIVYDSHEETLCVYHNGHP